MKRSVYPMHRNSFSHVRKKNACELDRFLETNLRHVSHVIKHIKTASGEHELMSTKKIGTEVNK